MTIDWTPHPDDPDTILASVDGAHCGQVSTANGNWYGWVSLTATMRWPAENTEPAARALVESAIRRALVGA